MKTLVCDKPAQASDAKPEIKALRFSKMVLEMLFSIPANSMSFDKKNAMHHSPMHDLVTAQAQPILDAFYDAVVTCGREPQFKPSVIIASAPDATRYDPVSQAIILVPYEALQPPRRAAMDRFAAIGTLGLSGLEQCIEVFNNLLVAHELGHWLQEMAQRPLNRWQAEYQANQIMVAFWREHPAAPPAAATERRLANFVAQSPNTPSPIPDNLGVSIEEYFNAHLAEIESSPMAYAGFQKMMVRQALAEQPAPSFCQLVANA